MLKKAFRLIELSIAIIVISVVITGIMSVVSVNKNNSNIKITNDRIKVINRALGEFVRVNKRLPCPASIKAIKITDATYGVEGTAAGTCNAGTGVYLSTVTGANKMVYGMIPVKSLGLSNDYGEDGFGSKFAYIIDKTYTTGATFSTSSGSILIQKYINGAYVSDSNNAIFAIISYGPNKSSSFNANSSSPNIFTSDADERFNGPTTLNDDAKTADFSQTLVNSSERSTTFDDIVFYKSRDQFLKDSKAANIVNGNITSSANITATTCNYAVTGGSPSTGTVSSGSGKINCDTANHYSSAGYSYICSNSTLISGTCACAAGYSGAGCSTQNCTGGTISSDSGATIHTFTYSTSLQSLDCRDKGTRTAQLLLVAGGGSGGSHLDTEDIGGGGGGGVFYASAVSLNAASYHVSVGAGVAGSQNLAGSNGNNSSLYISLFPLVPLVTVYGGGGGGGNGTASKSGGSGGGGHASYDGGTSTIGSKSDSVSGEFYGNNGGKSTGSAGGGGGGAGASAAGGNASNSNGGNGGSGFTSYISGSPQVYGSGGGGNGTGTKGVGGTNAGNAGTTNKNAASNFGGGGGAAVKGNNFGGSGGSGVIIIRY